MLGVLALLVVGGGLAAWWIGANALAVRDDLEASKATVSAYQTAATEQRFSDLPALAAQLDVSSSDAVMPTTSPIWRIGELVPVAGENLRAVRIIAEGVNDLSAEVVTPASTMLGEFTLERDPASGGFDVAPLRAASEISTSAASIVTGLRAELAGVDSNSTIPQVAEAVAEFDGLLDTADEAIPQVNGALTAVTELLGVNGPRNVVLAFLNNAEAAALGGGPAAQTLLTVGAGAVDVTRQVSSGDFHVVPVDVELDDSAEQLYDDILLNQVNATTSRPDFPTAAQLISAYWQRDQGVTPDVVISLDPLGLSRLLQVTGPVTTTEGEQLTSDNVVSKLLNEAYFRYPDGAGSDEYFAAAASAVFDRIMSVDYDVWAMAEAVTDVAGSGSLMMWSNDPVTQALFDGTRLQGTLPQANDGSSVLGVYFRDRSSSKIDTYLHTEATVTTDACTPGAPTYEVEVRLQFDLPEVELPSYVDSGLYDFYRTEVFLYGPVDATTESVEVLEGGLNSVAGPSVVDLGRPAEKFTVDLVDGQVAVVRATFEGTIGEHGPTEVRTTPMINATAVKLEEAACG
ncbi:hypothetical protein GCM10009573_08140 [Agromyces bracchium]